MQRRVIGLISLFLMALLAGCANSVPKPTPVLQMCTVPAHLVKPLTAPSLSSNSNAGLLDLLAAYEQQRRRFNADRASVVEILTHDVGGEE